tara:strand:- start:646 stop:840 length:195 start_codon:yes stop_codon:yes gene_type:complete
MCVDYQDFKYKKLTEKIIKIFDEVYLPVAKKYDCKCLTSLYEAAEGQILNCFSKPPLVKLRNII